MHAGIQVKKEKDDEDKEVRRPSGLRTARRSKTPNRDNKPEPELYELSSHSSRRGHGSGEVEQPALPGHHHVLVTPKKELFVSDKASDKAQRLYAKISRLDWDTP